MRQQGHSLYYLYTSFRCLSDGLCSCYVSQVAQCSLAEGLAVGANLLPAKTAHCTEQPTHLYMSMPVANKAMVPTNGITANATTPACGNTICCSCMWRSRPAASAAAAKRLLVEVALRSKHHSGYSGPVAVDDGVCLLSGCCCFWMCCTDLQATADHAKQKQMFDSAHLR
jgi:hypothetical protein